MSLGILFVPADKQNPQGFGSALTYCKRYALQTAFGVPTEDDDGNAGSKTATSTNGNSKSAVISQKQHDDLIALADEAKVPIQQIKDAYKVTDLARLPAEMFDRAVASLKRAAERNKEPAHA